MDEHEWAVIQAGKWEVDARLLEARPVRRCALSECQGYCCSGGVWLDVGEAHRIRQNAEMIKPFLPEERRDEYQWFDGVFDLDEGYPTGWAVGTHVVSDPTHPAGQTCVFLRSEDRKCAIQMASMANGQHKWELKPTHCYLHPLTIDGKWLGLDDDNEIYQEGGSCQREEPGARVPLFVLFEEELWRFVGEEGYGVLESEFRKKQ